MTDVKLSENIKAERVHGAPVAPGSDLYRIRYEIHSTEDPPTGGLIKFYEIWPSRDYVEDKKNLKREATKEQVLEYADKYLKSRYKEKGKVPPEAGVFLSKETGEVFGSPNSFPLSAPSGLKNVKTTILIPKDTHKWLKIYATEQETSLSDILRRIIMLFVEEQRQKKER